MTKLLDPHAAWTLSDALMEVLDDLGFPPEEAIPGLIATIQRLARTFRRPDQVLDEASEMLADGIE